jgi:DNA excision repair protein ERCC-4
MKIEPITPTVIIDTREQDPLPIHRWPVIRAGLTTGDYSLAGAEHLFAVERKSIADLVMSCTTERERFERELHRLRGFQFARLLIVGTLAEVRDGAFHSKASPVAILNSLSAFEVRYSVPVVWADTPTEAAERVEGWAYWFAREIAKQAAAMMPP